MAVMAPLLVSDWDQFVRDVRRAKDKGFRSLSVDVWWGLVQKESAEYFDWSYYDKLFAILQSEDLDWIPILSTHACGGNVGDDCNIPLPEWAWHLAPDLSYVSESNSLNRDCLAHFADSLVIPHYKNFWRAFRERYLEISLDPTSKCPRAFEVGLSLGPSGELHYPAYHHHDQHDVRASYPLRGLFQGLGPRADREFRDYLADRYTDSATALNRVWGSAYHNFESVSLSSLLSVINDDLEQSYSLWSPITIDILSWYHHSLMNHLDRMMRAAFEVFASDFTIALKIPGVHWQEQRHAELMNGLLDPHDASVSWDKEEMGLGYASLFAVIRDVLDDLPALKTRVYITAAATSDSQEPFSRAESLVRAFSNLAFRVGVPLGLENALAGDLYSEASLKIIEEHLRSGRADAATFLRLEDVLRSEVLNAQRCQRLLEAF